MGGEIGPRSDLYSLGVVLYEGLTGVRPFDGPSPAAVALERLRVKPRPIRSIDPTLPRSLEQIVMRLLERRPEARPASAADVASELDGFRVRELGGRRRPGRRPRDGARIAAVAAMPLSPPLARRRRNDDRDTTGRSAAPRGGAAGGPGCGRGGASPSSWWAPSARSWCSAEDRPTMGAVLDQTFQPAPSAQAVVIPTRHQPPSPLPASS